MCGIAGFLSAGGSQDQISIPNLPSLEDEVSLLEISCCEIATL
jgi:hypothetical protein